MAALGHTAIGLDGAAAFAAMARADTGCEIWQQDFLDLELPSNRFDGIFANASLFHVPSQELPRVLRQLHAALKPAGVLFSSNPRGENDEGWISGRLRRLPRPGRLASSPVECRLHGTRALLSTYWIASRTAAVASKCVARNLKRSPPTASPPAPSRRDWRGLFFPIPDTKRGLARISSPLQPKWSPVDHPRLEPGGGAISRSVARSKSAKLTCGKYRPFGRRTHH
jgi:SAM-dependent methyltransferase